MVRLKHSLISLGLFLLFGCSTLIGESVGPGRSGFQSQLRPKDEPLPLPVEIAADIATLSEEGAVVLKPQDQLLQNDPAADVRNQVETEDQDPLVGDDGERGPLFSNSEKKQMGPLGLQDLGVVRSGKSTVHKVRLGDTLMEISFEKYANYLRWREIYKANRRKMSHWRKMPVGILLTIPNYSEVRITRNGKPYLIKKGETLKSIAAKVYGNSNRWRELWKNNPELIRNPLKIYAGFTLFYQNSEPAKMRRPTNLPEKEI